jgi:hypothetical protein
MQHLDYYSEPESYQPRGVVLSTDEAAKLARLLRELQDHTQSRATFAAAGELLSRVTGEPDLSSIVRQDILAQ